MASSKTCRQCGDPLPPNKGRGRPRTRCEACAPSPLKVVRSPKAAEPDAQPAARVTGSGLSLYAATRAKLEENGLLEDPSGVAAMILAEQLDLRDDTGSSLAALARTHAQLVAEAMTRRRSEADPVDRILHAVAEKSGTS